MKATSIKDLCSKCSRLSGPSITELREKTHLHLLILKHPRSTDAQWTAAEIKNFVAANAPNLQAPDLTSLQDLMVLDFLDLGPLRWILDQKDWRVVTVANQKITIEDDSATFDFPICFFNPSAAHMAAEHIVRELAKRLDQRFPICVENWGPYRFEAFLSPMNSDIWFRLIAGNSTA